MNSVELVIEPRKRDLGGFSVGRVLPFARRRMVGPFVFFDEMGPAVFPPHGGMDVRPHPHIGLATVTWLFDGEIRHRDSVGSDQLIHPGDVNWMVAGKGIVHSERTDDAARSEGQRMHGIQSWVALPEDKQECAPTFQHCPKDTLPVIRKDGVEMRLIAGKAFGKTSPVKTFSPMFYLAVDAKNDAVIPVPDDEERALYVVSGAVVADGASFGPGKMIVFAPDTTPEVRTTRDTRAMLLGGAPLGERKIWWNLVSTSDERIEKAKADWLASSEANFKDSAFALPPDETEFIPLPDA